MAPTPPHPGRAVAFPWDFVAVVPAENVVFPRTVEARLASQALDFKRQ